MQRRGATSTAEVADICCPTSRCLRVPIRNNTLPSAVTAFLLMTTFVRPGVATAQLVSTDTVVSTPRAQLHVFHSRLNGRDYRLWVAIPASYSRTTVRYPVLYLLDGGRSFPIATAMYRQSRRPDSLIMVGVGYVNTQGEARMADYTLPLTPRSDSLERSWAAKNECCAADLTRRVFREEIIPFIDSMYRTTGDRGLFGHSFTGLFTAYVLLKDPDLFSRYAITSPAL